MEFEVSEEIRRMNEVGPSGAVHTVMLDVGILTMAL